MVETIAMHYNRKRLGPLFSLCAHVHMCLIFGVETNSPYIRVWCDYPLGLALNTLKTREDDIHLAPLGHL